MGSPVLALYNWLVPLPAGRWLFSRIICLKAPYFSSIAPRIESLAPDRGVATLRHRRRVTNHLGTVHAIALCNLAEFIGGLTCDVATPAGMRWIPKSMTVDYLMRATGTMRATATPGFAPVQAVEGYELPMQVEIANADGEPVFRARIAMWVSPRRQRTS